jgi:hypothetical protein
MVQGPLAMRADVTVDRSQPAEDRIEPLTVNQVNDGGLRLQGCSVAAGIQGFAGEIRDHLSGLAATEVFAPACRPCERPAFQACTTS